jgi:hypothetical protein
MRQTSKEDDLGVPMTLPMTFPFAAYSTPPQVFGQHQLGDFGHKPAPVTRQPLADPASLKCGLGAASEHEAAKDDSSVGDVSTTDENISASPKSAIDTLPDNSLEQYVLEECMPCNTGSLGHPDFCSRPCLYFAEGACNNGDACGFCHLDHKKGLVHLDKRNRQILTKLSFPERATYILPIVKDRVQQLGLTESLKAMKDFENMIKDVPQNYTAVKVTSRESKKLRHLLKCLKVQELFKWLKSADASPSVLVSLDILA